MKRWKKGVTAAAEGGSNAARDNFDDKVDITKDNFDFAVEGILKIAADGELAKAEELITKLNGLVDSAISEITSNIAGG